MIIANTSTLRKKNYIDISIPNTNTLGFRFFYNNNCWKFSSNMYTSILKKDEGELIFSFNKYHGKVIGYYISPNNKFGDWPIYIYNNSSSSICYETYAETQEIESPEEMLSEEQIAFLKRNSDVYFALEE